MLLLHNHHCHTATMLTQPARGPVSHARPVQNQPKVQTAKRCARQLRIFLLSAVFAGSLHVTSTARYRRAAVALSFCSLSLAASLPLFLTGGPRHLFAAISGHQLPWIHQGRYDLVSWLVLCAGVHCAGVVLAVQCVCVLSLSHVCVGWCRLCSLAYLMQLYRLRGECNGK